MTTERRKQLNEAHKRYMRKHPEKRRIQNWRRLGIRITVQEYESILTSQDCKCAICHRPASQFQRALAIDHDHKTGKIRGLLCFTCNRTVGILKDNPEICRRMATYLDSSLVS